MSIPNLQDLLKILSQMTSATDVSSKKYHKNPRDVINKIYDMALQLKNPDAIYKIALVCEASGMAHYDQAIAFYKKAIKLNHPDAMCKIAWILEHGVRIKPQPVHAHRLYHKAAGLNHPHATYKVGLILEKKENYPEAIKYYDKAIKLGSSAAMYKRASLYETGIHGSETDERLAEALYEQAARSKNASAIYRQAERKLAQIKENNPGIKNLYMQIEKMLEYGNQLGPFTPKGILVCSHARTLKENVDAFLTQSYVPLMEKEDITTEEKDTFTQQSYEFEDKFIELLHAKDKEMNTHRETWKPIVANIGIALTGIGLIALLIKAAAHAINVSNNQTEFSWNKMGFFAATTSESLTNNIHDSFNNIADLEDNPKSTPK